MKKSKSLKSIPILLVALIFLSGCASTTRIQSNPSGAKLYIDGESVGETPYVYTDNKIVSSCTWIRLEKEGYLPLETEFCRDEEPDVGAIIGGLFIGFPFLWAMKYKPVHRYELIPLSEVYYDEEEQMDKRLPIKSKADELRELKQLLDEGILTKEEFEREKKKILEGK